MKISVTLRPGRKFSARDHRALVATAIAAAAATLALGIGLVITVPPATNSRINSTREAARQPNSAREVAMAVNTWLLPDDEYFQKYPPTVVTSDPVNVSRQAATSLQSQTPDGPASRRLLALTLAASAAASDLSAVPHQLVDITAPGAPTIGSLSFMLANGSLVTATQQQLVKPLPYGAVRVTDNSQITTWPNGTTVVVVTGPSTIQVLAVNRDGLMTQITARGVLAAQVPVPLTRTQLLNMARTIDTSIAQGK